MARNIAHAQKVSSEYTLTYTLFKNRPLQLTMLTHNLIMRISADFIAGRGMKGTIYSFVYSLLLCVS
jgi:hypothetical protein